MSGRTSSSTTTPRKRGSFAAAGTRRCRARRKVPSPPRPDQADDEVVGAESGDGDGDGAEADDASAPVEEVVVPWKTFARMLSEARSTLLEARGDPAAYATCVRQMWGFLKPRHHLVDHLGGAFPTMHEIVAVFKIHTFLKTCFFKHDAATDSMSLDDVRRLAQRHVGSLDAHGQTDVSVSIVALVLLCMKAVPPTVFASKAEPQNILLPLEFIDNDTASAYNVHQVVDGVTALVMGLRDCPAWFPNRMFKAAEVMFRWCATAQSAFDDLSYVKYLCTTAGSLYFMGDMFRYYTSVRDVLPMRKPRVSAQRWFDEEVLENPALTFVCARDWGRAHMKPDTARLQQCYRCELGTVTFPYEQRVPERYRLRLMRPMPWEVLRAQPVTSAKPWLWMPVAAFYLAVIERVGYYHPHGSFIALQEALAPLVTPQRVAADHASLTGSAYWVASIPEIVAASSSSSGAVAAGPAPM